MVFISFGFSVFVLFPNILCIFILLLQELAKNLAEIAAQKMGGKDADEREEICRGKGRDMQSAERRERKRG